MTYLLLNAEAGGFEPPVRLPVRQFSKLVVSATHPNFLSAFIFKCSAKVQHFSDIQRDYTFFFQQNANIFDF